MNGILALSAFCIAGTTSAADTYTPGPAATTPAYVSSPAVNTVLYAQSSDMELPGAIRLSAARYSGSPSPTARKYYRFGARAYDNGDFEGAEVAFNQALRAKSRELIPDIVLYLAKINEQQGDMDKAFLYAFVYLQLSGSEEPVEEVLEDPDLELTR